MGEYYRKLIVLMLIFGLLMPFLGVLAQNTGEGPDMDEKGNNMPFKILKGVASSSKPFLDKLREFGKEKIGLFFKGLTEKINDWWKNRAKDWAQELYQKFLLLLEKEIIIR